MNQPVNEAQSKFWNDQQGRNWVDHQADLDAMHENITTLLLDACAAAPGEAVLDIGCGAGASTFALARAVGPAGQVHGLDISEPLTRRATERQKELGVSNTSFALADAQDHDFAGQRFDLIASRFGVMFFSDPVAAFSNIAKSLRPGGRIAFVTWAGPAVNPWFRLPHEIAINRLGPMEPTPPDAPGPMAFRDIDRVCGILRAAGFSDSNGQYVETDLHHPGGVAAASALAGHVGPAARLVREKGGTPEDLTALLDGIGAALASFASDDGIRIPAGINVYRASR